jgi:hypothetical protein
VPGNVAVNLLAMARSEVGSLNRVSQVVRLAGYVNCVPGFAEAPALLNGAPCTRATCHAKPPSRVS